MADCRPAVAVAADFHPEADSRPEVDSSPEEDCRREDACSGRRVRIYLYRHSGSRTVHSRYCDREICFPSPIRGSYLVDLSFVRAAAASLPAAGCGDPNILPSSGRWCSGSFSTRYLAAFLSRQSPGQGRAESACTDCASLDRLSDWREPRGGDPVQLTCKTVWDACERVPPFTWTYGKPWQEKASSSFWLRSGKKYIAAKDGRALLYPAMMAAGSASGFGVAHSSILAHNTGRSIGRSRRCFRLMRLAG